jgi:hypothetical protein
MKALFSKVSQVNLPFFTRGDITTIDSSVSLFEVNRIAESVNPYTIRKHPEFEELEKSVLQSMKHPIILVPNNSVNYDRAKAGMKNPWDMQGFYPNRPYLCIFGNQRLEIARRNDYTHISAVLTLDINKAIVMGNHFESSSV